MGMKAGKLIFVAALHAAAVGTGYYGYNKLVTPKPAAQLVKAQAGKNILLGGFANHVTDAAHLNCMESGLGQRLDLSLRFVMLKEIANLPVGVFPREEAELMQERKGNLYMRLKISKTDIKPHLHEKYAEGLARFAKEASAFSGPIMLEPYFDAEAAKEPAAEKKRMLGLLADSLKDNTNITWVWNPALGQTPGSIAPKWTSLNATQKLVKGKWATFAETYAAQIKNLGPDQPIVLFVASTAPADSLDARSFVRAAMQAALTESRIKAIVLFNAPLAEGNKASAGILSNMSLESLRGQMSANSGRLSLDVMGNLETRPLPQIPAEECSQTRQTFDTPAEARQRKALLQTIPRLEQKLEQFKDSRHESALREALARKYLELASLEKDEEKILAILEEARQVIDQPLADAAKLKDVGKTKRYPIVTKYFDLKLQLAAFYSTRGNQKKAGELQQEVLAELKQAQVLVEQQVNEYSKTGYEHRAYLEMAVVYEKLEDHPEAAKLYAKTAEWATKEQGQNRLRLLWRGENRFKLRYIAAQAKLGLVRTSFSQKKTVTQDQINGLLQILAWEDCGREDGFMDLGFGAFVSLMRAYLAAEPETARARFNSDLPWRKIDTYEDLKRALDLEGRDLAASSLDKWPLIIEGLAQAELPNNNVKNGLVIIREASEGME